MPKTALVTGATGLLGRSVLQAFQRADWQVFGTGLTRADQSLIRRVDLFDQAAVEAALDEVKPQAVVHCAANRFPDKCDNDPEGTRALNIDSSRALAQATNSRNILLLYISTDYVFPGKPGEAPYAADATPQPTNIYGQTKLDGEKAVLEETQGRGLGLVLRIPVLYGDAKEPKESAINVLMDSVWKAQDADVKMDNWALRYPTNTEDVARVCVDVVSKYLDQTAKDLPRILQFSSEDRYTKYEICQLFGDIMGLATNRIVSDKPSEESKSGVQRPYDTHLSTQSLQALGIDVQTMDFTAWWRREVKAYRK